MADELRLWAINVDRFRQCFAAPEDLAQHLWTITDTVLAAQIPKRTGGLLSKLGPLMRHPSESAVVRPGIPNRMDAEAMMTSRFISNDRLTACWTIAKAWLDDLAVTSTTIELGRDLIDDFEFDLVRVEVPTQIGIRHLWQRGLDIPLRASETMSIGYMEHDTVHRLVDAWQIALPELEEQTAQFVSALLDFATPFTESSASDDVDLVACWTRR